MVKASKKQRKIPCSVAGGMGDGVGVGGGGGWGGWICSLTDSLLIV